MSQMIATRIAEVSNHWRGRAFLYELQKQQQKQFVVASCVWNIFSGPETMVFETNADGVAENFSGLTSIRELNPDRAIAAMDYKIVSCPLAPLKLENFVPIYKDSDNFEIKPGKLIQFTRNRLQMYVIQGKWNQAEPLDFDIFNQMDLIDSSYCLLLSQPKYEKDFKLIMIEILHGEKVYTVLSQNQNPEEQTEFNPLGGEVLFKIVK